ncbi:dof zinc finger protein DOF1.6-like [Punica granatum]|uniref:Dof zinc finger protein n=2 Tax=Punica granatum TaxID=22663 RepID=A0A218WYY4_PUNGR|nr:dof zinc finger protein DOF1.6-like [Punica granatum]OWM77441.1 hypothetical protein CDL15_Pgr016838 [Punica granatum]PKI50396.1 hypothetical protein CRG98_029224 [Punica granatum]
MDQFRKEGGNNTLRAGSPSERRMQQHQQNHPGARPNAPTHPPPPPQQGHKCPRCDSTNTKFCYYNNYSLTQPRYFCKACRRYWTQGGTLRNVPVGGGCRKGSKRAKASTAATTSAAASSRAQPPPGTVAPPIMSSNTSYYPSGGGGFLSSLAAIQSSIGQSPLDLGGSGSSGMNIGFLQGLGILPPLSSQAHLFRAPPPPPGFSNNEWVNTQGFMSNLGSNNDNPSGNIAGSADSTSFWSPNRTSGGATNSAATGDRDSAGEGTSMNPNQWLGLPGYGPPQ